MAANQPRGEAQKSRYNKWVAGSCPYCGGKNIAVKETTTKKGLLKRKHFICQNTSCRAENSFGNKNLFGESS